MKFKFKDTLKELSFSKRNADGSFIYDIVEKPFTNYGFKNYLRIKFNFFRKVLKP